MKYFITSATDFVRFVGEAATVQPSVPLQGALRSPYGMILAGRCRQPLGGK
jgi:hypothetical protein